MTDTVKVPRDDDSRSFSDSLLPEAMIWAGIGVQEQVDRDNANYIAGETTDWDQGMIAVAIYRAMVAVVAEVRRQNPDAFAQPEAPKVEQEPCPERGMGVCDCSQFHPAPASDELLEAAEFLADRVADHEHSLEADDFYGHVLPALSRYRLAKHKGPQS